MTFKYLMWVLRQYREPRMTGTAEKPNGIICITSSTQQSLDTIIKFCFADFNLRELQNSKFIDVGLIEI